MLDKLKKEKTLNRWSLIQIGDNRGMFVFEFANKSKMNQALKAKPTHRKDVLTDPVEMQWWAYHGTVKANS